MKNGAREFGVASVATAAATQRRATASDYLALTKPRLNLLVVATSAAAYYLGMPAEPDWARMAVAVGATALVAGGAAVLNQVSERDTDALMTRTRGRPLPDGRLSVAEARAFGVVLAATGVAILAFGANLLAALLALLTLVIYLAVYTPLKRHASAATLVGAIPGALPPLIGWTAAQGAISIGGLVLFAIVFLWQIPHFMAIAWLYRDDYKRAGFPMLAVIEPDGTRTGRQALMYALALLPVSLAPTFSGIAGWTYLALALPLGAALVVLAAQFAHRRSARTARLLFLGSITYLPLVWASMILDH